MSNDARAAMSRPDIERRLQELVGWDLEGTAEHPVIARTFAFPSYGDGVAFAVKVAMLAERTNHHPDSLEIGFKRVRVAFTTHDAHGVTERDFEAAVRVAQL